MAIGENKKMNFKHVNEAVKNVFQDWAQDLKDSARAEGHVATGELLDSIGINAKEEEEGVEVSLHIEDYYKYLDQGLPADTWVPVDQLQEWASAKNLAQGESVTSLAYAVQHKIHDRGTRGSDFYNEIINDDAIGQLIARLEIELAKDVKLEIAQFIEGLKKQQRQQR